MNSSCHHQVLVTFSVLSTFLLSCKAQLSGLGIRELRSFKKFRLSKKSTGIALT